MQSTNPRLRCFVVALLLLNVWPALSQEINFNKVPLPDDIVGSITGITQDLRGNIWVSPGGSGLYQYDGVHFKPYLNDPFDAASLASNRVECVYGDKSGNIWAGTFGFGLDKFDPLTNTFTHYKHNEKDPTSISGDTVTCIIQDREGFLWIGTNWNGVNRLDPTTGKFTHYKHNSNDPNSLSFNQVRVVYEDKQGVVWVGAGSNVTADRENSGKKGGLNRFNSATGNFTSYLHDEKNSQSLIDNRVRAIFEDSHGNFWVGTAGDGLHTLDRTSGKFERHAYDPQHPEKLSRPSLKRIVDWADDNITFITEDSRRLIWIGTFGNGLSRYNPSTKRIKHYPEQKNSVNNVPDPTTWWIFTSRDGVMWMSTWNVGLFRFDPSHQNILRSELPTKSRVWSFVQEPDPIHYFGSASGLVRINTKDNSTKVFAVDSKKPESISGNLIFTLYKDKKKRIWAGTNGGLNLFNPDKQNFTSYEHDSAIGSSLAHDQILCLYEDEASNFWVGTINGLDRMNGQKREFTHYKTYPNDTVLGGKNLVACILEDSKHNLWVGNHNAGGLHILDRATGKFKDYLPNQSILSVREVQGKIWVGTASGLYSYNIAQDNFTLFIDPTSGNTITVLGMVEGNDENLWLASVSGIYRINDNRNEVSKFSRGFGINAESLGVIAAYKANDGKLIFGNTNGYYSLYPDSVSGNAKPPEIILTDFRIADQQIKPGTGNALKEDLLRAKRIELSHDQNVFAFFFNVIHYSNPDANKAMYTLENYDQNWHPGSSEHSANYYNIPPGHYIFHIKAASSENIWAEKSIEIVIANPWWRNGWAYAIYGLVFVSGAWATDRFQKRRIVLAERKKNQLKELAQAKEIEKAYHELKLTQSQLIQSEKMASLGELTAGIAHEIQNPLNFVNNFSEVNSELIVEMKAEIDKGNLNEAKAIADSITENEQKIIFHGKRADTIVKGMLQHSRSSSGVKEPTDLNALADEYLRLAYHGLRAKDKSFNASMKTDFDGTLGKVSITPQDIGRVILNLITNAFYAVSEKKSTSGIEDKYEPTVTVSTRKSDGKAEIRVMDNGNGIPQKVMDKIFQPFFTTKPTGKGTGLGLSLSYDIVRAHGGELNVHSKEGEFAEFVVLLPLG